MSSLLFLLLQDKSDLYEIYRSWRERERKKDVLSKNPLAKRYLGSLFFLFVRKTQ